MTYTDEDLAQLITCQKRITQPPRKDMRSEGQMLRNEMELVSLDGEHSFHVFMRQSRTFSENFSLGIVYLPKDEPRSFCIFRCNGRHGGTKIHPYHSRCHIHLSKAEDVNAGLRVERHIEPIGDYAAFLDALNFFLDKINVTAADLSQYFPNTIQTELF
jgi:hypothetical protein